VCAVHGSSVAESVMPGRLVAGPWILNPDMGVRIAPRQPVSKVSKGGSSLRSNSENSGSGEGYGYFSCPENTSYPQVPSS
jgi:hypothetical protein